MIILVLALAIFAAVFIPWAIRYDRVLAALEALDDEELAAVLDEFPDLLDWRRKP